MKVINFNLLWREICESVCVGGGGKGESDSKAALAEPDWGYHVFNLSYFIL